MNEKSLAAIGAAYIVLRDLEARCRAARYELEKATRLRQEARDALVAAIDGQDEQWGRVISVAE